MFESRYYLWTCCHLYSYGIGIKKAFNGNGGIKLEFGFRFTNTDYLDDVSGTYFDWAANGGIHKNK